MQRRLYDQMRIMSGEREREWSLPNKPSSSGFDSVAVAVSGSGSGSIQQLLNAIDLEPGLDIEDAFQVKRPIRWHYFAAPSSPPVPKPGNPSRSSKSTTTNPKPSKTVSCSPIPH